MNLKHTNKPKYLLSTVEATEEFEELKSQKDVQLFNAQSNQIYFYSDVARESVYVLNRQLVEVEKHLKYVQFTYNLIKPPDIELYISSEGGDVFSSFSTVDRIKSSTIPVNTYVEGIAASAATLLSVVGHRRYIRRNSFMLIHQLSSGMWGSFAQFKDEMQNLELIMRFIKKIYLTHTKMKEKELTELLKHDLHLDAEECKKLGLVDEII